jgi:16S rRNA (cytosine1402-N4)-methyltransferase
MSQEFAHRPVLVDEVVAALCVVPAGLFIDATVGAGGHSRAVLAAAPQLKLLGLDRDSDAIAAAAAELMSSFGASRVVLRHARFDALSTAVAALANGPVTAALFDLGVSSPQLDRPERGFSYRGAGPLDMRMDQTSSLTAADVVNGYSAANLAALFAANGEARFAGRIARAIVAARPVADTLTLAEVIKQAIPAAARRTGGHPAKRVFQAIRIEVNDELSVLATALDSALDLLAPGGRCAVLSYHSGEDRLVKERFVRAERGGCVCPPGLPCMCGAVSEFRLMKRGAIKASAEEIAVNRRAESARLRVIERTLQAERGAR